MNDVGGTLAARTIRNMHELATAPRDVLLGVRAACREVAASYEFGPVSPESLVVEEHCMNAVKRIDAELARRERLAERLLEGALI